MSKPRYRRRKEDRPREIAEAAFDAFAEHGYASTPVEEVARRAGVSKGLLYLYYKTKEDLFKAVVRNVVVRRIDALVDVADATELSSEDFVRGPVCEFLKQVPGSPVAVIVRLLIAEGPKHPDLLEFYHRAVVSKGLTTVQDTIARGVARGEFRASEVDNLPHLVLAPVLTSIIWGILFAKKSLDTDKLIETQLDMLLHYIKA